MGYDFDPDYYFSSTGEEGDKHYWAKIKETGEIVEIPKEIVRFFWADDRKVHRHSQMDNHLSLDTIRCDEWDSWLDDHLVGMSKMEILPEEEEFKKLLSPKQLEVYEHCIRGNEGVRAFAKRKGLHHKAVEKIIEIIQKKGKKYFF